MGILIAAGVIVAVVLAGIGLWIYVTVKATSRDT